MKDRVISFVVVIFIIGEIIRGSNAYGLPQFPVRYGSDIYDGHLHEGELKTMDCRVCHVNPTGGGMRNQHGRLFSVEKLPMQEASEEYKKLIGSAMVNHFLSIGTDIRFVYLHAQSESTSAYKDSFFRCRAISMLHLLQTAIFQSTIRMAFNKTGRCSVL